MRIVQTAIISGLLGLLTLAAPAFAQGDCAQKFRNDGKVIVRALMKRGYTSFGSLSFSRYLRHVDSVNVMPSSNLLGRQDLRSTARWSRENGVLTVKIDCAWYNQFPQMDRSVLAFHDFAWSFGVDDEKYWLSMGGYLLSQKFFHDSLSPEEVKHFKNNMGKIVTASSQGGVIGIGGGGEIYTVSCKLRPILSSLQAMKTAQTAAERETAEKAFSYFFMRDLNCLPGHRLEGR